MATVAYIKQYSKLYSDYNSNCPNELADLDSVMKQYIYIKKPSQSKLPGQIELHMFWQIPLPPRLVRALESCIEQGVFFKRNPDVYYYVSEKYWPLVRHFTGASLVCREVKNSDFTYSMELYKKAPRHFDLTELNYNSLECLEQVGKLTEKCKIINLECLKYVDVKVERFRNLQYICKLGMLNCIKWLYKTVQLYITNNYTETLVRYGHVDCLRYIKNHRIRSMDSWSYVAGKYGQVECLKYLHECGFDLDNALLAATLFGKLNCLIYLREVAGYDLSTVNLRFSSNCDHVETFAYIFNNYPSDYHSEFSGAICGGALKCVKFMHANGLEFAEDLTGACTLKMLKYMHRAGCVLDFYMLENAPSYRMIRYMHERSKDFIWLDAREELISDVSLPCMRYIYEKGYRNKYSMLSCILANQYDLVKYLIDQGEDGTECLCEMVKSDRGFAVERLHKLGVPWGDALKYATNKRIAIYMYNHGARCENMTRIFMEANDFRFVSYRLTRLMGLAPNRYLEKTIKWPVAISISADVSDAD